MLISLISFVLYPSASNQVLILMIISFNERINAFNPVIKLTFNKDTRQWPTIMFLTYFLNSNKNNNNNNVYLYSPLSYNKLQQWQYWK